MTKFVFLRHAQSITNNGSRVCGQLDSLLSEIGLAQAKEACEYIVKNYKIDKIYSSDLTRVKQTIAPAVQMLGLQPIYNEDLRECCLGTWQGKTFDEIKLEEPDIFAKYKAGDTTVVLGGAESFDMVYKRAKAVVDMIAKECDGQTVLVASHGGVIREIFRHWLNISDNEMRAKHEIANASISEVLYDGKTANISFISKYDYLSADTPDFSTKMFAE